MVKKWNTTKKLMELINALQDQGTTIVFVSHDMDLVDRYCERLIVIDQGNICFQGTPDELWEQEKIVDHAHLRLPFRVRIDKEQKRIKKMNEEEAGGCYNLLIQQ